eukprot:5852001-Amphidinium_carterae.1
MACCSQFDGAGFLRCEFGWLVGEQPKAASLGSVNSSPHVLAVGNALPPSTSALSKRTLKCTVPTRIITY